MIQNRKKLSTGLVLIFSIFFTGHVYNQTKAPDFELKNINGGIEKLSDYKDKVVILDFWDTWCPPCRAEIPDFIDLTKKYKDDVVIIGAAFANRGIEAVKQFYKEFEMNYPVVIADRKVVKDYGGIRSIPTTFVIDKQGIIYKKYIGQREKSVFEEDIQNLLKEGK